MAPAGFETFMVHDPNLLPIGSTYELMSINAVDYLLTKGKRKGATFCAMVRDDPYGIAGYKGWKYALDKSGEKLAVTAHFAAADKDFTGQISQLKSGNCQVVLVTTVPPQLVSIAGSAARASFAPQWVGQLASWHSALIGTPVIDYLEKNMLIAGEGVEWGTAGVPGMAGMLAKLHRFKPDQKPDMFITVGYNQGRAITALLEKAVALGDVSREGMMKALAQLGPVDNEGLGGNYKYGPVAQRQPALAGSVFKINRNKPFGLEALEVNQVSGLARSFAAEDGSAAK
jgi:ABC-type branched-subunit amino acid transport system substrate-binding protein